MALVVGNVVYGQEVSRWNSIVFGRSRSLSSLFREFGSFHSLHRDVSYFKMSLNSPTHTF